MNPTLRTLSFSILAATALLAGCNKIKASVIEDVIKQDAAKKGHALKSVTCPEGRDFKDDSFECKGVDSAGTAVTFKVTVKLTHGDKADIRYSGTVDGKLLGN